MIPDVIYIAIQNDRIYTGEEVSIMSEAKNVMPSEKKNPKSRIAVLLVLVLLVILAIVILKQHTDITRYREGVSAGFSENGTYTDSLEEQNVYFVFVKEKHRIYHYKPSEKVFAGTYSETDDPNVYIIKMDDGSRAYAVFGQETLTCIKGNTVKQYLKLSNGGIYNDVPDPEADGSAEMSPQ